MKETLEEAAEKLFPINSTGSCMEMLNKHQLYNSYKQEGFVEGAKWQAEKDKQIINSLNDTLNKIGQKNIDNLFLHKKHS